jgi:hypothetical protein
MPEPEMIGRPQAGKQGGPHVKTPEIMSLPFLVRRVRRKALLRLATVDFQSRRLGVKVCGKRRVPSELRGRVLLLVPYRA